MFSKCKFVKISQNTCVGVSFQYRMTLQKDNFKRHSNADVSCEYSQFCKNSVYYRTPHLTFVNKTFMTFALYTGRKFNVHLTFRRSRLSIPPEKSKSPKVSYVFRGNRNETFSERLMYVAIYAQCPEGVKFCKVT